MFSLKLTPNIMPYQVLRIRFSEGDPLKSLQCNMSIDVRLTDINIFTSFTISIQNVKLYSQFVQNIMFIHRNLKYASKVMDIAFIAKTVKLNGQSIPSIHYLRL